MRHTRPEMDEQDKPGSTGDEPAETTASEAAPERGRSAIEIIRAGVASARDPIADRVVVVLTLFALSAWRATVSSGPGTSGRARVSGESAR